MNPKQIDELARLSAFGSDTDRANARYKIWNLALERGIIPSSINELYMARGRGELPPNFTVPAMNLRGMAYDTARSVFLVANKLKVGALICELARSEMGYTDQPPGEYSSIVMSAALREGWSGPLFIQCDHFQSKVADPGVPKAGEIEIIKNLIEEAINAGFFNVDIDMSTLVDLDKKTEKEQQSENIKHSIEMAKHVRGLEPKGVTISLGGEVGHIGGKNSTMEEVGAYMEGFNSSLSKEMIGLSKISIQTGTSHGGIVMSDGTLADIDVDFAALAAISKGSREKYKLGGAVQHGASTLPDDYFSEFVKSEALEVHLATGFQNILLEHKNFPTALREKMYMWLDDTKQDEKKDGWTDEQFHYKLRKKTLGRFKREIWEIDEENRSQIRESLANRFEFFYKQRTFLVFMSYGDL